MGIGVKDFVMTDKPMWTGVKGILAGVMLAMILSACSSDEDILPGERIGIRPDSRQGVDGGVEIDGGPAGGIQEFEMPPVRSNIAWTHINSVPTHFGSHVSLPAQLSHSWSVGIGSGNAKRLRLSSEPVVADGRIFTLDSSAGARAFDLDGKLLWQVDLSPSQEAANEVTGGGLAYGDNTLVATTGFGEVIALDPASGEVRWRHRLDAAVSSAPSINNGLVVVVGRDDEAVGLSLSEGRIQWRQFGAGDSSGILGGGSPAIADQLVVLPFASGEVIAVLPETGVSVWSSTVSGGRRGLSRSRIGAISGDPVVGPEAVYVGNQAGKLVALDSRTGLINWSVDDGTFGPVWPAGTSVFVVTDRANLKSLSDADGSERWSVQLPEFDDPEDREGVYVHFGPVLAGGRLLVAGSDGFLRSFDPGTGEMLSSMELPGQAASRPAIANGVMYLLTADGELHAFN